MDVLPETDDASQQIDIRLHIHLAQLSVDCFETIGDLRTPLLERK